MKTVLDINILHKRTREKHKKICDSYKKRIVNTTRNESVLQLISQMNFLDGQRFVVIKFDVKSYFDNFDEVTSRDLLRRKSSFLYKKLSVYRHVHSVSIQTGEGIKAGLPLSNLIGEIMGEEIVMSL